MAMAVVVVVIMVVVVVVIMVALIFVMSVGMTVAVIVVFMVPIAGVVAIATRVMLILRVRPDCSGIRWPLIVACDPLIVVSLGSPEALYPNMLWCWGRRRRRLEVNWWRCDADGDRNL
jgi:hypothetical protein